ncbi:class I SAM-dependent methyltransferase [Acidithiobacillus sp. IBUN Pt1247-S3]|uniref:class I SAM-dependent methyltransferase n=1 Tax=Acidithiobacillus sp. IBUN Pt1247-S3 TaxID=3166642 RepID=UPI0034E5EC72
MKDLRTNFLDHVKKGLQGQPLPLRLIFWDGHEYAFAEDVRVTMHIKTAKIVTHLLVGSALDVLGEAYVEGDLDMEGSYQDILAVAEGLGSAFPGKKPKTGILHKALHSKAKDKEAIHYHYDVSNAFYQLWLDRNMVYSCGYFKTGEEDIDTAQEQKLDHICRKLHLQPGEKLLDIGCGWGGLLSWAARHYGIHGVGVTLSEEQFAFAKERMAREGLADRMEIRLQDYRDIPEREHFDKVSSVGMFEHVGRAKLPEYFDVIQRVLKEGGWVMNHGITASQQDDEGGHHSGSDFIDKYVFPDGEIPHLWRVVRDMAGASLEVLDVENLRPHYAQTLIHWVRRLEAHKAEAVAMVGPQRYRIWAIYMAGCAYAFWRNWSALHQVLAVKQRGEALTPRPWERRYQYVDHDPFRLAEPDWGDV